MIHWFFSYIQEKEQISAIMKYLKKNISKKDKAYISRIRKLSKYNIRHVKIAGLPDHDEQYLKDYYMREIYPLLSPQIH